MQLILHTSCGPHSNIHLVFHNYHFFSYTINSHQSSGFFWRKNTRNEWYSFAEKHPQIMIFPCRETLVTNDNHLQRNLSTIWYHHAKKFSQRMIISCRETLKKNDTSLHRNTTKMLFLLRCFALKAHVDTSIINSYLLCSHNFLFLSHLIIYYQNEIGIYICSFTNFKLDLK